MTWESLEMARVEGTFLTLAGGDLWDHVEHVAWQARENLRRKGREAARARQSTVDGRRQHCEASRALRQRNKTVDAVVRCCPVCRQMHVHTLQQQKDGTRFCSQQCAGRYRYGRQEQPRPTRFVVIDGQRRSLPEWAKHFGISVSRVYQRMSEGMSAGDALTAPKDAGGPKRVRLVTIDGETRSVTEWAKHFGIDVHSVYVRVKRGMDIATALSAPKADKLRRPVTIDGETRSLTEWRKHFGVAQSTVENRMRRRGMSIVEALTAPKTPGAGPKPRRRA
jgi:hypothetical protein